MSATNNPTSLGLYIAYSAAMHLSSSSDTDPLPKLRDLKDTLTRTLHGKPTAQDRKWLLKAASSAFFFLYLMSAYEHGAKNKRLLADEMRDIKAQIAAINAKLLHT